MLFTSLTFIFLFLPCVLGIYYLLIKNRKAQNIFLLLASLIFYAWGGTQACILLIISVIINWLLALIIGKTKIHILKRISLAISIVFNVGLLFIFKYLNFIINQLNRIGNFGISVKEISLPIGISFFTFQALSYVIDVYNGEKCQKNPLYVGLYIAFFPQLIAGPIVRYNAVAEQIENRKGTVDSFKIGIYRFIQGFLKKVLLANTMGSIADKAFILGGTGLTVSFAWLGSFAYTLQIYFDFSGYSDMAIGLGRMFGFEFEENFNHPYISLSITEFWRRWHISLSRWFRDYVYIPLGGSKTGNRFHNYWNLFIVWLLTGIWHGANWTFIIWGLLYFVFLFLEKVTGIRKFFEKNKILGHVYSITIVNFLWVIFRSNNISQAIFYIKTMLGINHFPLYSSLTGIYIKENWIYILFAILFSYNIFKKINHWYETKFTHSQQMIISKNIIIEILMCVLFVISISYVINGTYNPFIYFHF